jgi:IS605 OrfB family transposase
VKVVKAVRFAYKPTPETRELLETFRMMVNDAIHICLEEKINGRLNIRNRIYREFQDRYGVPWCYPYSVAEIAWSIIKKHKRWHRRPCARRPMMKMDAANYSLHYAVLSLQFKKGQSRTIIPLQYGDYQRSFLMDNTVKRGSVTITDTRILITFSKEAEATAPLRRVGYDLNEKSVIGSDGTRHDLSEVARLHTLYGVRRRDFYKGHPHDRRLKQKFASSRREKERVKQELHRVSTQIVEKARRNQEAVVLERLKGIRSAHEKGNGEGRGRRRRIALWPFRELQQQIEYKCAWSGVPVEYVSALWTSKTCSVCGYVNRKLKVTDRSWQCPCGAMLDRDLNAAVNIERRGKIRCLGEARPGARDTDEAMKQEPRRPETVGNPAAEVPKLSQHPTKR